MDRKRLKRSACRLGKLAPVGRFIIDVFSLRRELSKVLCGTRIASYRNRTADCPEAIRTEITNVRFIL